MSRSIARTHTLAAYRKALETLGVFHYATWAAWGRMVAVWGIRRSPRAPFAEATSDLFDVAAVAYARATGNHASLYTGVIA